MKYLIDTCVISELISKKPNPKVVEFVDSLEPELEHKTYEQLFRETYIEPLHLRRTEFLWSNMSKLRAVNWVPGYEMKEGQYVKVKRKTAVKDAHNELGAGSIVMSNSDLAKTIEYILHGNMLTKHSKEILFKGKAPTFYNGGLYNLKKYKSANGAGKDITPLCVALRMVRI